MAQSQDRYITQKPEYLTRAKAWRERNNDRFKQLQLLWRAANITTDRQREYYRTWAAKNPEALLAVRKKSAVKTAAKYHANKDAFKRKACPDCGVKKLNPGRCTACHEKVRPKADPKKREAANRRHNAKRNAVVRGAPKAEGIDPFSIFNRDGWRCTYCRRDTPAQHRGKHIESSPELDHRTPISRGGTHTADNVALACRWCNGRKQAKTPDEFLQWLAAFT